MLIADVIFLRCHCAGLILAVAPSMQICITRAKKKITIKGVRTPAQKLDANTPDSKSEVNNELESHALDHSAIIAFKVETKTCAPGRKHLIYQQCLKIWAVFSKIYVIGHLTG